MPFRTRFLNPGVLAFLWSGALVAQAPAAAWKLDLTPPKDAEPLMAKATVPAGTEWVVLFYRREGESEFESFALEAGPDGTFTGRLEMSLPPGIRLEYYAAMRGPAGRNLLPAGAPKAFNTLETGGAGSPNAPAPSAPAPVSTPSASPASTETAHGPVSVDATLSDVVHRQVETPGEKVFLASGQVRYAVAQDEGDRHLKLQTRLVYTDQPAPNQPAWSMGEFQASFAQGPHLLQAGDITTQESEFTLGGGGRRGIDYSYAGDTRAHLFGLNTEHQAGMRGLLWPTSGSEVYGGALGQTWWGDRIKAKLVLLSGRDDPSTAANVTTATAPSVHEGSTGAVVLDGKFLENRFTVGGEYARSSYTASADSQSKASDQAWRISTLWNDGPFSAHAGYRDVGREFGTVGVAFFVADRRVFDGSVGLNYAGWGLSATAQDERTNPTGQAGLPEAWSRTQGLDLRLSLLPTLSWRTGLHHGQQEAGFAFTPLIPFSNSERTGLNTGLDWILPPSSSLTFNAQVDRLRATGAADSTGTGTTLSLGGTLAPVAWAKLSPSLSWARTESDPGSQVTTVSNAFLNAEFTFIPKVLALLLNGGQSHSNLPGGVDLRSTTEEASLVFTLDTYLRGRARGSLGLKGRYVRTPLAGASLEDRRALLVLNVSF